MRQHQLFFIFLFSCSWSVAQHAGKQIDHDFMNDRTPATPASAGLGSFGNLPINYYSGQPEISLPLMTLTSRDLSVPISLNYDASGLKTDEISGPVGIKWNLNAGGFVVRQLNGLPDEHPTLGYWKYANSTNYYSDLSDPKDWVKYSEKNERDCEPDEFVININGRSIRFVFDKYKKPVPIPHQNVKISYTLQNEKIYQFTVITEDGTKYIFGGDETSVEERKIETRKYNFLFVYTRIADGIKDGGPAYHHFYGVLGGERISQELDHVNASTKTIDFFNSKWYLKQILAPSTDYVNLSYIKLATNLVYASKPVAIKVTPHLVPLNNYSYKDDNGITWKHPGPLNFYTGLTGDVDTNYPNSKLWAIREFNDTHKYIISSYTTNGVSGDSTNLYFNPENRKANPGAVSTVQSLITESNIKLISIIAASGVSLQTQSSIREDLPNGIKYDRIWLSSSEGQQIKSVKLNYITMNAKEDATDYLWANEAFMLSRIALEEPGPFYGYHARNYSDTDIQDADGSRKYAYEGLKIYNYKRLFLESIAEESLTQNITLYEFGYKDRELLRRRTTPMHTKYGFSRDTRTPETDFYLGDDKWAKLSNSSYPWYNLSDIDTNPNDQTITHGEPTRGMLNKIIYPTKGRTEFEYEYSIHNVGPRIRFVKDFDQNGETPVRQKEIFYPSSATLNQEYITGYYTDFAVKDTESWMKFATSSTGPLNSITTTGVFESNDIVYVYNGTVANHEGYEKFVFADWQQDLDQDEDHDHQDNYKDQLTPISTIPSHELESNFPFPFLRRYQKDHLRGVLIEHHVYSKSNTPIKSTINKYQVNPENYSASVIYGFQGGRYVQTSDDEEDFWGGTTNPKYNYRYGRYEIHADWQVLRKKTETTFDPVNSSKNITLVTEYKYDVENLQMIESKVYNSLLADNKIITKTKYPTSSDFDYLTTSDCREQYFDCIMNCMSNPDADGRSACFTNCLNAKESCIEQVGNANIHAGAIISLRNRHQISTPVETQTLVADGSTMKVINANLYKFKQFGSTNTFIQPVEIWGLSGPIANFNESFIDNNGIFQGDNRYRKLHSFDSYDLLTSNILQQTSMDGNVTEYVWGFNNSLVTSKILNPGSSEHRTTYNHKMGVGVISITDPNLRNQYYSYDNFNRLKLTKDHDNNITERYRYSYQGEKVELPQGSLGFTGCHMINQEVSFSAAVATANGETVYQWDFGDGQTLTTTTGWTTHTYSTTGPKEVKVKRTNSEYFGETSSSTSVLIGSPITEATICANGITSYDICDINPPVTNQCGPPTESLTGGGEESLMVGGPGGVSLPTLRVIVNGNVNSYAWQYRINGGTWNSFGTSSPSVVGPPSFGDAIPRGYEVICTVYDHCNNPITTQSFSLSVYASTNCQ